MEKKYKVYIFIFIIKLVVIKVIKVGGAILNSVPKKERIYSYLFGTCQKDQVVLVCSAIGRNKDPYSTDGLCSSMEKNLTIYEEDRLKAIGETYSVLKVSSELRKLKLHVKSLSYIELGLTIDKHRIWYNAKNIKKNIKRYDIVVAPGFIGKNKKNEPATLKREGSDYSAAIIGAGLRLKEIYLFKDMPGLYDEEGNLYNEVSYEEFLKYTDGFSSPISLDCINYARKNKMRIICLNTDGQKVLKIGV